MLISVMVYGQEAMSKELVLFTQMETISPSYYWEAYYEKSSAIQW